MADSSLVYKFACKWLDKFNDPKISSYELTDDMSFSDECISLNFKMDCGHDFSEKYNDAFNNTQIFKQIIDEITDIELLGSAIHSKWRYYNHWAYDSSEIREPENKEWFIIAFERLKSISKKCDTENKKVITNCNLK